MFIVKRKRGGSSARSSRSSSHHSSQQQSQESDGSSHHSGSGSVKLKSILRKDTGDDENNTTPSKAESSSNAPSGSQYSLYSSGKRVAFKHVHVREFERIIGDNPSCSSGAPIAIGWAFDKDRTMMVDEYEAARPPRRELPQLVLTRQDREEILVEWGASFNEIIDSIRANVKAKNQRRRTVSSLDRYDRFEEYMENASRRLKRTLLLKKPIRKQAEEMADQSTRFSKVTYIDRPPQQPQQQRLADVAPRQPPRAPESPRPPSMADHEAMYNIHDYNDDNGEHDVAMEGRTEEQAPCRVQMDGRPIPLVDFDTLDDDSMYFDQNVPVRFIGGSADLPPQYYQQLQFHDLSLDAQQFYLQQLYMQQQQREQGQSNDPASAVTEDLTYDGDETDGLESLGHSYWGDDGMDAPGTRRRMAAVIISEDGQYEADDGWDNGFTLQPPPHSNSIVSSWE